MTGIVAGRYLFSSPSFLPLLYFIEITILILAFLAYFFRKIRMTTLLILTAVFLWGILHFCIHYFPSPGDIAKYAPSPNPVKITGKIINSPRLREGRRKRITFMMQALWIEKETREKAQGKVWVTSFFPYRSYGYGDIVRVKGKLRIPRKAQKEGDFDWQRYLSYQGVWTEVNTGKVEVLEKGRGNFLIQLAFSSRNWMRRKIDEILPPLHSFILKGILLGDREELPPEVLRNFRTTGTAHVLVVSGLHVGLVLFIFLVLFRIFCLSSKVVFCLALPVITYYAFMTGLRPPILRATLMVGIGIISYLLDRKVDPLVLLSLAAFFILIVNPLSIFTVSFQLSFLAVGGIIYLTPFFEKKLKFLPSWLKKSLSVSSAAQLSLLPLLAFYFGQLPLIGVVANLIIVPLITVILALGFFSLTLAIFTLEGARIVSNTSWFVIEGLLHIIELLSFFWAPHLTLWFSPRISPFPRSLLFLYYALLIILPYSRYLFRRSNS